jgi:hypothetical protein
VDHSREDVAARYDQSVGPMFHDDVVGRTVDVLAELAGDGAALELAIGTGPGYVGYDRYTDLVAQQATSHHFVADGSGGREDRTPFRYVWPAELDLMARLAGMSLRHRWADWDRSTFTGESTSHVSVWEKTDN